MAKYVKYVNPNQMFGDMMKQAVEFQDGLQKKAGFRLYRVRHSFVRFKEQLPTSLNVSHRIRWYKFLKTKIVRVQICLFDREEFTTKVIADGWFVLRKDK